MSIYITCVVGIPDVKVGRERRQMWGRGARKGRVHGGDIAFTHSPVVFRS